MRKIIVAVAVVVGFSMTVGPAFADKAEDASSESTETSSASDDSTSNEAPPSDDATDEPAPSDTPPAQDAEDVDNPEPTPGTPTATPNEADPSTSNDDSSNPEDDAKPKDDKQSDDGKAPQTVPEEDAEPAGDAIAICHWNADTNDFSQESATADATAGGHDADGDDIIPPFDFAGGSYPGKNYDDAGKSILDNGCAPVIGPDLFAAKLQQQALVGAIVLAAAKQASITICHRTNSANNPYVTQNPSPTGDVSGHANHTGPVFQVGFTNADNWGDIIPPFDINGVSFPGLNWDAAGQAIFNAGCVFVAPGDPVPQTGDVVICHATGVDPPFAKLSAPANGTVGGHAAHGFDIIPPFDINGVSFPGLNWDDDGEEIFDDDCVRNGSDDDDDDDGDDDDDSDDDDSSGLPNAGGAPLWVLLMASSLIAGGVALVNNRQVIRAGGLLAGPGSPLVPSWAELVAQPVSGRHAKLDAEPVWTETPSHEPAVRQDTWKWTLKASIAVAIVAFLVRHIAK